MKKTIIGSAIVFIFLVVLSAYLIFSSVDEIKSEYSKAENSIKKEVGKKVILEKDTLTIIDYSILNDTYTLSNGVKVSFELVEKLKKVE